MSTPLIMRSKARNASAASACRSRRISLIAAAAFLLVLAVPRAEGAVHFNAPQTLSQAGSSSPALAIDSKDRITVVWSLYKNLDPTLQIARIGTGGVAGSAHSLTPHTSEPQVSVDPDGSATVVGVQYPSPPNGSAKILAIHVDASGTSATVQTVFSKAGWYGAEPQVDVDSQGRATVVWSSRHLSETRVEAVRLAADGTPEPVQTLSAVEHAVREPQVASDSEGRATVVWTADEGSDTRIQTVRITADGLPGESQALSEAGRDAFAPRLAIDSENRATVVWGVETAGETVVQALRLSADEVPEEVETVSGPLGRAPEPRVSIDSEDRAWVPWSRQEGAVEEFRWSVQAARLDADGAPGPILTLSGPDAGDPAIAIDSQDRAWVSWRQITGAGQGALRALRIDADGAPGPIQPPDLSSSNAYGPLVAIDSLDRPTLLWSGPDRVMSTRGEFAPPDTRIDSESATWPSITYSFSSPDLGVGGFECSLDHAAFEACESPTTYSAALDVLHDFEVRARDEDGIDPTPAATSFILFHPQPAQPGFDNARTALADTTPPQTTIIRHHSKRGSHGTARRFWFRSSESGSTFLCRLDQRKITPCLSPKSYGNLKPGRHRFRIWASDIVGNKDPTPAVARFRSPRT
jgi:hypothetical protein